MSKPTRIIKAVPRKTGHWFFLRRPDRWARISKKDAVEMVRANQAELVVSPSGEEINKILA